MYSMLLCSVFTSKQAKDATYQISFMLLCSVFISKQAKDATYQVSFMLLCSVFISKQAKMQHHDQVSSMPLCLVFYHNYNLSKYL